MSRNLVAARDARVKPGHDELFVIYTQFVMAGLDPAICQGGEE
jgi:hypothetical protein